MIAANYITEWAAEHPWRLNEQVEQDLFEEVGKASEAGGDVLFRGSHP